MVDVRYQVFVSSTYFDLQSERQLVTSALLELDAFPAGMELFPAADDDAWTLIKRVIDECDYYLLIVGGRYGSVDVDDGLSYTEKEYDYASSRGKPVMAFLHGAPDTIPAGKTERTPETIALLDNFRHKVQAARHVKFWTSAEELAGKVALSFSAFIKQYPAIGWVRADTQSSSETLSELNIARNRISKLENSLERSRQLPPPGTEALAQGSDTVALWVSVSAVLVAPDRTRLRYQLRTQLEATWDQVLAALGPSLLGEALQENLSRELEGSLLRDFWYDDLLPSFLVKAGVEAEKAEEVKFEGHKLELDSDDFDTIIVQLKALGLIAPSAKKRSVSDRGTYWSLTPYGETRTVQLRAQKRPVKFPTLLERLAQNVLAYRSAAEGKEDK